MCHFSQYRKEAFGSRENQLLCEARGETVKPTDDRYVSACGWIVSVFLHETMSAGVKNQPDWLDKAKQSLAVVVDTSVDEYSSDYDIFSETFLAEAVRVIEFCVREHEW